ncbi:MAG TPA: amidohydrolase family protein [Gammaproteobacteria bacterium]
MNRSPLRLFDAHFHVIDRRFPLVPNRGYLPDDFGCADYLAQARPLGVVGGAVVSGSFQACDQGYLRDALARLGPAYVGVTQLPPTVSDREILELDAAGVRAVRCNLFRGGSTDLAGLDRLARRVHELAGWHVELYVDSRELGGLHARLAALPALCIDHLGLYRDGLPDLLRLVERGARVKATGFGRGDLDIPATLRAVCALAPEALLFGTDLPSTRAPRPFEPADLELVVEALGRQLASRVLFDNAVALYRPAGLGVEEAR